ncbi:MAG TPA: hypothetical protein VGR28_07630 [Candidatus Thermoplasmatota archaeon]|jgi:hypothetical protein|nr:hypothetical protein [Candidatus Thermoplasmatota archaeon]
MRWTGTLTAVAVVALLALPTALSVQEQSAVSGHVSYSDMGGMDPCLAGIAGIVRSQVLWFGGQVLFERTASGDNQFIYAVENGAPDPRELPLIRTGEVYEFPDLNDDTHTWSVVEYEYHVPPGVDDAQYHPPPTEEQPIVGEVPSGTPSATWTYDPDVAYYAWVVHLGPTLNDDIATGRPYNFVNVVDTCKMMNTTDVDHNLTSEGWSSSDPADDTYDAHPDGMGSHDHSGVLVDLYVGDTPWEAPSQQDPDGTPPPAIADQGEGFAGEVGP